MVKSSKFKSFLKEYKESVLIGDSSTDFEAASKWGTISIGVLTGNSSGESKDVIQPDYWKKDLWEAVDFLLNDFQ